jgi:hypothetical protein
MNIYHSIKKICKYTLNEISALTINFSLFKVKSSVLLPIINKKIISFSLFGSDKKYFANIDSCIKSYQIWFPEWIFRVYVSDDLPNEVLKKFEQQNCELIVMAGRQTDFRYTFWRFLALDDKSVSCVLIRDIDSIASEREKIMVDQWLNSNQILHIIRDHPDHSDLIMGGMFDRHFDPSFNVKKAMIKFKKLNTLGVDQQFLKLIYEHYLPSILVHDIFKRYDEEEPIIIPHADKNSFIGEININHQHKQRDLMVLKRFYDDKT